VINSIACVIDYLLTNLRLGRERRGLVEHPLFLACAGRDTPWHGYDSRAPWLDSLACGRGTGRTMRMTKRSHAHRRHSAATGIQVRPDDRVPLSSPMPRPKPFAVLHRRHAIDPFPFSAKIPCSSHHYRTSIPAAEDSRIAKHRRPTPRLQTPLLHVARRVGSGSRPHRYWEET